MKIKFCICCNNQIKDSLGSQKYCNSCKNHHLETMSLKQENSNLRMQLMKLKIIAYGVPDGRQRKTHYLEKMQDEGLI